LKDSVAGNFPLLGDQIGIIADLFAVSVAVFWDVTRLLQQRQVTVTLDISYKSRVPIIIPGTTKASRAIHNADVFRPDARLDHAHRI
jgi:hypothetical protein